MAWKQIRKGDTIELRNSYDRVVGKRDNKGYPSSEISDFGQILIIVREDTVRISMNGPCNLLPTQWETLKEWVESAQEELREDGH